MIPIIDPSRTEFGEYASSCDCDDCKINCLFIPGFLIPADLDRMIPEGGDPYIWARDHLRASPGALAMKDGQAFRIRTLVPAHRADFSCCFLKDSRCTIYESAPFGCRFANHTTPPNDPLGNKGLVSVMRAWNDRDSLYCRLWEYLARHNLLSPSPETKRAMMGRAMAQRDRPSPESA